LPHTRHRIGLIARPISAAYSSFHAVTNRHHCNTLEQPDMNSEQILAEIREANLSYLMLAQSLVRVDRDQALFRLGINEDTAKLLSRLTPAQMMKMAVGNTLLCRFRMDDDVVWNLLTNHGKASANEGVSRLHASILMAGRHQEAA
jgi:flagellar transcriptional activator FlhD